jgi:hypothetical protein
MRAISATRRRSLLSDDEADAQARRLLDGVLRDGTPVVALAFWFRGREPSAVRGTGTSAAALYHWHRTTERR